MDISDPVLPRAVWIDRFVMQLSRLGAPGDPGEVGAWATEAWETLGHLDPVEAAQFEFDEWPSPDV
jgi:hypothetical protein